MIARHIIFVASILILAVVQATISPIILPAWLQPDFMLIIVVLLGLFFQPAPGSIYAFGIGYLMDLMLGVVPGTFTFERLLIFLMAYWLSGQFYAKSPFVQGIIAGVFVLIDYAMILALTSIFSGAGAIGVKFWYVFPRMAITTVMGFVLYYPLVILWEGGQREL